MNNPRRHIPELPMFYIDCTRPLDEQLTRGQLAWIRQWAEHDADFTADPE